MGPLTMAVMGLLLAAILSTSLSGNKGSGWACLAFLVALLGAQTATYFASIPIMSPFLVISAMLVFKWKHWVGYAICLLYAVRLAWIGINGLLGLPPAVFWEFNNLWFVAFQALFGLYGGFMDGGFKHLSEHVRATFGLGDRSVTASDRRDKID